MRKSLSALVIGLATIGGLTWPGTSQADWSPEPWEPWEQQEWTIAPGKYCDFGFRLDVIHQDIERRTLERYDDGTVKHEQYRGPLVSDFIRTDTGDKYRDDASGQAIMSYYPDGSLKVITTIGPVGAGFRAEDDYPRGYYNLDGFHVVTTDPDGTRHMDVDGGTETDICAELSD